MHSRPWSSSRAVERTTWLRDLLCARFASGPPGFHLCRHRRLFPSCSGCPAPHVDDHLRQRCPDAPERTERHDAARRRAAAAVLTRVLTLIQQLFLARLQTQLTVAGSFRFVDHPLHLAHQVLHPHASRVSSSAGSTRSAASTPCSPALRHRWGRPRGTAALSRRHGGVQPLLAAIGVAASLLNVVALAYVSRRRDAANQLQLQENARLAGLGMTTVGAIESIKTTGSGDAAYERWAGFQARYLVAGEMGRLTNALAAVPATLSGFTSVLCWRSVGWPSCPASCRWASSSASRRCLPRSWPHRPTRVPGESGADRPGPTPAGQRRTGELRGSPLRARYGCRDLGRSIGRLEGSLELRDVEFGYLPP